MISWMKHKLKTDKPFLILGKGPTFSKHIKYNLDDFTLIGLNHVAEILKIEYCHFIDLDVFSPKIWENANYIVAPVHPHINFRPSKLTLQNHLRKKYHEKFLYYNCSTWKNIPFDSSPVIQARYFSIEAVFNLLIEQDIFTVFTLGIDGGKDYANEFLKMGLKPLKNSQKSFDKQTKILKKLPIKWIKL